jgi:hypothetical protein
MGLGGELTGTDLVKVPVDGISDDRSQVGVLLHEFGRILLTEAQDVMDDEYLTVTVGSRADADGRDARCRGGCSLRPHGPGDVPYRLPDLG